MNQQNEQDFATGAAVPLATIGQRIGARAIDWGLLLVVWLLVGAATSERLDDGTLVFQRWAVIAWMVLVLAYEVCFVAARGQTIGKRIIGIKVVSLKGGATLTWPAALTRVLPVGFAIALLGVFFPIAMVFVYFSAAFLADSRGVLDLISGSVVVNP